MRPVPEWEHHAASMLCWPGRREVWGDFLDSARDEYARLARLIVGYEPVIVFANESDCRDARLRCGPAVEVATMDSDDAWLRDTGPVFCKDGQGKLTAATLRFNAWGGKYDPYGRDAAVGGAVAEYLGLPVVDVDVVGEGGALCTDGRRLITTTSVLANPSRNPGRTRVELEARLRVGLGVDEVLWLSRGLRDDVDTDGHIDNLLWLANDATAFVLDVPANHPDFEIVDELRRLLQRHDFALVPVSHGSRPGVIAGSRAPMSMLNCYALNGALVVPVFGEDDMQLAIEQFQPYLPSREVRPFISPVMAFGGGGAHCVTLGLPA